LDRRLPSATIYPADYGFVPGTVGSDGDPLDALVLVEEPTFPGCVIEVRVLAVFRMSDEKGSDPKLITVPDSEVRWADAFDLSDVPDPLLSEIEHFFDVYKDLEPGKSVETGGFAGRDAAVAELEKSLCRGRRSP
jgi:inorganic pyrophosphatase